MNCTKLKSIKLPNTAKTLGYSLFYNCSLLSEIELPQSLTKVEYSAFAKCTGLSVIDFPESIASMANWVTQSCNCKIIFRRSTVPSGVTASEGSRNWGSGNIYVPDESVDLYKSTWSNLSSRIYPISQLP